ncbi:Rieske 2Fe-2S domain-containing protein [Acerihabitans sp. KWT182]|uniref:Rieske 2Fe-2S domain-containing protein n=1 Tax=Acerihabitans sp. KWT182 TaxID=3157919 RepID=A0AAU7QCS9_9GAMM
MNPLDYWWPVALSHKLKHTPLACQLYDMPLVLFRTENGLPAALPDRCPHRSAPLSAGIVSDGQIQCPYHGWRFDADGSCTRVPGIQHVQCSKPLLISPLICEAHGLVWVNIGAGPPSKSPIGPAEHHHKLDTFWITHQVGCSLLDASENFLDGFHTHFVHSGWIRRDKKRQKISVLVRPIEEGIEAVYSGEGKQSGLISRLLEGERGVSIGRFRLPCLSEIEYLDRQDNLTLRVSTWLTPCGNGQLSLFARIATARGWLPAPLKRSVLNRLFQVILSQDRQILEKVSANKQRFETFQVPLLDGPQDLLGPSIRHLLEHDEQLFMEERHFNFWL